MELVLFALLTIVIFIWLYPRGKSEQTNPFGIEGEPIYIDEGRSSPVFVSHKFKQCAKPDFIYKLKGLKGYALVEHKHSYRDIQKSDIAQVKSSVIAVRSKYSKLNTAYVSTKKGLYVVDVNKSSEKLMKDIRKFHNIVQDIYAGNEMNQFCDNQKNCAKCSVSKSCRRSL